MSGEIIAILAVGATLAGLMLAGVRGIRTDVHNMDNRIQGELKRLETRLETRFERLEKRMAAMGHGQAKLEGLLEGLREAIAGRAS